MSHLNLELYKRVEDMRRQDERLQADMWRLSRLALQGHQGWLSQQGCWLLCQLGHWMVSLGQQLQRYGLSNATS